MLVGWEVSTEVISCDDLVQKTNFEFLDNVDNMEVELGANHGGYGVTHYHVHETVYKYEIKDFEAQSNNPTKEQQQSNNKFLQSFLILQHVNRMNFQFQHS